MDNKTPDYIETLDVSAERIRQSRDRSVYSKEATHEDWMRVKDELRGNIFGGRGSAFIHRDETLIALINRLFPGEIPEKSGEENKKKKE